jgi:hypothetical protein
MATCSPTGGETSPWTGGVRYRCGPAALSFVRSFSSTGGSKVPGVFVTAVLTIEAFANQSNAFEQEVGEVERFLSRASSKQAHSTTMSR